MKVHLWLKGKKLIKNIYLIIHGIYFYFIKKKNIINNNEAVSLKKY